MAASTVARAPRIPREEPAPKFLCRTILIVHAASRDPQHARTLGGRDRPLESAVAMALWHVSLAVALEVQLEIMQRPLLEALEHDAKIPIFQDSQNIPGRQKPKHEFEASDLVIATQAFIEYNPQLKKPDEAEGLLEREEGYTDWVN